MNRKIIKFSFIRKDVKVDEQKKTCEVVLEAIIRYAKPFNEHHWKALITDNLNKYGIHTFDYPAKVALVLGKATCTKGDTFDELTGIRIAESKAKAKLYRASIKTLQNLNAYLNKILEDVDDTWDTYTCFYKTESDHIKDLDKQDSAKKRFNVTYVVMSEMTHYDIEAKDREDALRIAESLPYDGDQIMENLEVKYEYTSQDVLHCESKENE